MADLAVPAAYSVKIKEIEKSDRNLDLARELKNMEHEGDDDTNCNWCPRGLIKGLEDL